MGVNLIKGTFALTNECGFRGSVPKSDTYNGFLVANVEYTLPDTAGSSFFDAWVLYGLLDPEPDEYYTLSFYAKKKADSETSIMATYFYPECCVSGVSSQGRTTALPDGNMPFVLSDTWERYWVTWKTRSEVSGTKNLIVCRCQAGMNAGQTAKYDICGVKFEKGKEATPWKPSPLDLPSYTFVSDMFEQGTFNERVSNNLVYGSMKIDSNNRIRSKDLIQVSAEKIAVHANSGCSHFILEFQDEKYLGKYSGWQTEDKWYDLDPRTTHIALAFNKANGSTIAPSEIAQICGGGVDCMSTKATASITLAKVDDGVDAFTIVYDSPNGLEFSDSVKSIAITAKVFKGGKELTDAEVNKFGAIKWYQVGVTAAIATGKTLTLTAPKEVYATLEN